MAGRNKVAIGPGPDPEIFLAVGTITKPHGIKGEVKIVPYAGVPEDFKHFRTLVLTRPARPQALALTNSALAFIGREIAVVAARAQASNALVLLSGIIDRSGAVLLAGLEAWTRREFLPVAVADAFYWHDTVGRAVHTEDGREIGTVQGLMATGAHGILVVSGPRGKEYLIPALPAFWKRVDGADGALIVVPVPGLLEMND